ncbi:hypothetical protein BU16DRAFT_554200 [Lophium mytilinum]|uniref:Uncharacterized protein n=1 Tax=Lophium mytilinum TaxID=390894 RepID=A0A6A6RF94_9PEZI|nr:hypothetical protein BU16DRAFT_554200 [Lophium mytilinum]
MSTPAASLGPNTRNIFKRHLFTQVKAFVQSEARQATTRPAGALQAGQPLANPPSHLGTSPATDALIDLPHLDDSGVVPRTIALYSGGLNPQHRPGISTAMYEEEEKEGTPLRETGCGEHSMCDACLEQVFRHALADESKYHPECCDQELAPTFFNVETFKPLEN